MNLGELQKKHTPASVPPPAPRPQPVPEEQVVDSYPNSVPVAHEVGHQDGYNQVPVASVAGAPEAMSELYLEDDAYYDDPLPPKKSSKLGWLFAGLVLVAFVVVAGLMYVQSRPVADEVTGTHAKATPAPRAKPPFAYFQPKASSPIKRESADTNYDAQVGIVSFKVFLPDSEVVLLSQQKQPDSFATGEGAFDALLAKMGAIKPLPVEKGNARIILGKGSTTDGPTLAYNTSGLLIFGRSTQSLTPKDWQNFVSQLELVQP